VDVAAIDVVFCRVIAKQAQVEKIGGARQKFERRKISLIERSGIGPDPTDAVLFQEPDKARPMPTGMAKFNRKPEISRQLHEKLAQRQLAVCRRQRRRKLNENYLELWPECFDCAEKRIEFRCAIAQTADVRDLAGKLAGKPKAGGSRFGPATNAIFRRSSVKGRIDFNRRKIVGVKFQPVRRWQIVWIKDTAPVFEAPCARADTYFLLVNQIQMKSGNYSFLSLEKDATLGEESALKI